MKRSALYLAIVLCAIAALLIVPSTVYAATRPLQQALTSLRNLSPSAFGDVTRWARNGAPQVTNTRFPADNAKLQVLNLGSTERSAVLSWLSGNGRSALYACGATDYMIGTNRPGTDMVAVIATPNPWRELKLASATLDQTMPGDIQVMSGFGAAQRSGLGAVACVSFKNLAAQTATRVVFAFPMINEAGDTVGTMTLDRKGTFSPNIDIMSFRTFSDFANNSSGPRGYRDNCAQLNFTVAALPIIQSRFTSFKVEHVEYADGTSYTAP